MTKKNLLPEEIFNKFSKDIFHCSSCNYCVDAVWSERNINHVCTTMEHFSANPSYSGKGFLAAARALVDGVELDLEGLAARVSTCTDCGNCEALCPTGLKPAALGKGLRDWLATEGYSPPRAIAARASIIQSGRNYPGNTAELVQSFETEIFEKPDVSFFIGCASSAGDSKELQSIRNIVRSMGLRANWINSDDSCCGAGLAELGSVAEGDAWRKKVARNVSAEIVVSGYECFWHLKNGTNLNLIAFPNWFFEKIKQKSIDLKLRTTERILDQVFLVETCQLKDRKSRNRTALTAELLFVEFLDAMSVGIRNNSYPSPYAICCSAGGGMPSLQVDASQRAARERYLLGDPEAVAVTLDPRCAYHFDKSLSQDFPVLGFAHFIDEYFEFKVKEEG